MNTRDLFKHLTKNSQHWTPKNIQEHELNQKLFLGYMILEAAQQNTLWQEVQDAYGMGADGLMRVLVTQAEMLATLYGICEDSEELGPILVKNQSSVDTMFEWCVVEAYVTHYFKMLKDNLPISSWTLMVSMVEAWLFQSEPKQPKPVWRFVILTKQGTVVESYKPGASIKEALDNCLNSLSQIDYMEIIEVSRMIGPPIKR